MERIITAIIIGVLIGLTLLAIIETIAKIFEAL